MSRSLEFDQSDNESSDMKLFINEEEDNDIEYQKRKLKKEANDDVRVERVVPGSTRRILNSKRSPGRQASILLDDIESPPNSEESNQISKKTWKENGKRQSSFNERRKEASKSPSAGKTSTVDLVTPEINSNKKKRLFDALLVPEDFNEEEKTENTGGRNLVMNDADDDEVVVSREKRPRLATSNSFRRNNENNTKFKSKYSDENIEKIDLEPDFKNKKAEPIDLSSPNISSNQKAYSFNEINQDDTPSSQSKKLSVLWDDDDVVDDIKFNSVKATSSTSKTVIDLKDSDEKKPPTKSISLLLDDYIEDEKFRKHQPLEKNSKEKVIDLSETRRHPQTVRDLLLSDDEDLEVRSLERKLPKQRHLPHRNAKKPSNTQARRYESFEEGDSFNSDGFPLDIIDDYEIEDDVVTPVPVPRRDPQESLYRSVPRNSIPPPYPRAPIVPPAPNNNTGMLNRLGGLFSGMFGWGGDRDQLDLARQDAVLARLLELQGIYDEFDPYDGEFEPGGRGRGRGRARIRQEFATNRNDPLYQLQFRDLKPEDYDALLKLDEKLDRSKKAATKSEIKSLKTEKVNDVAAETDGKCAICLDEYKKGAKIKRLPCDHVFDASCIEEWLKVSRTCPICKVDIREAAEKE